MVGSQPQQPLYILSNEYISFLFPLLPDISILEDIFQLIQTISENQIQQIYPPQKTNMHLLYSKLMVLGC